MPTPQDTPHLALPYIQPAQAQKHVTHNEALRRLDTVVQLAVLDRSRSDPPPTPADGDRHLVIAPGEGTATGAWAGRENAVAVWQDGAWAFHPPQPGWRAWIGTEGQIRVWDGSAWIPTGGGVPADISALTLGLNATADAQNRLAVAAPGTLLNHDGAGHQLKLNKAAAADTASLLFQTGFSGRAEIGTAGSDAFSLKVSADGTSWNTALAVAAASGVPDLAAGAMVGGQAAYHRGNAVGPVSQSGGIPTGAIVEYGSDANGEYTLFADGTMICMSPTFTLSVTIAAGAIFRSGTATWTFPKVFIQAPSVCQGRQNSTTAYWTVPGITTTTTAEVACMSYQSITSRAASMIAFGRWF